MTVNQADSNSWNSCLGPPKRVSTKSYFVECLDYFGRFSASKFGGNIDKYICSQSVESKIGSKEPKNRLKLTLQTPSKALLEENRARLVEIFLKLFKDQEIAHFMVTKVFPPVAKIEIGKEQKGICKFKIHCERRYVGKIGKIEQGGCDVALGAILSAGPLVEGVFDFAHRKFSLDWKNGLHAKQGILDLRIKEIKIDWQRQVDIRPYSLIFPVCRQSYQTIKNTLNLIHWK